MQIVIDIPDRIYKIIQSKRLNLIDIDVLEQAVKDGISLPKNNGRLIILSEDAVKRELERLSFSRQKWISEVGLSNATVAIIEADTNSEVNNGK